MSRYCSKCGKENDDTSKFCVECGEKIAGLHTINKIDKNDKNNRNDRNAIDKEDKNKQIILIGIVVVLVIAIAIVGAFAFISLSDSNTGNNYGSDESNNGFNLGTEGSTVTSSSISLSEVYGLAAALNSKAQSQDLSTISSVEYKGVTFTKEQCLYIFSKAIDMKNRGVTGDIEFRYYSSADSPLNSYITSYLTRSEYVDMAQRTHSWMDANGRAPNYTGVYIPGSPDFGPDYLLKVFTQVIINSNDGSLVSMVTL